MELTKLNPFDFSTKGVGQAGGSKAVNPGALTTGGGSAAGSSNLFAKQTEGINEAMNGQSVFTVGQAGVPNGVAGKKLNVVG